MSEDKNEAVIDSVEATIIEQKSPGVHNDWKLGKNYYYTEQTVPLLINGVAKKLDKAGYKFAAPEYFVTDSLGMTLAEFEDAVTENTVTKPAKIARR